MTARASKTVGTARFAIVKDNFICGFERIEPLSDGCVRITAFTMQNGTRVELPEAFVLPITSLPDMIGKALAALGRKVIASEDGSITVMH